MLRAPNSDATKLVKRLSSPLFGVAEDFGVRILTYLLRRRSPSGKQQEYELELGSQPGGFGEGKTDNWRC